MPYLEPEDDYFEVDENFEFNTGINKLIDQEVEKRVHERINGYEIAIERDKQSTEENYQQRKKIRELELQLERAEKTFIKQGFEQGKREILGGYLIGDKVWFPKKKYQSEPCTTCDGKGNVYANFDGVEVKAKCPKCSYGRIDKSEYIAIEGTFTEIKYLTYAEGRGLERKFHLKHKNVNGDNSTGFNNTSEFFKTQEECEAYILEIEKEGK